MPPQEIKELKPLKDNDRDYDAVEKQIIAIFRREFYLPLLRELQLKPKAVINDKSNKTFLLEAIKAGRIQFSKGRFYGRLGSGISRELKALGAKWDAKTRTFALPTSSLPVEVKNAIAMSEAGFSARINSIDQRLAKFLPEEIAGKLSIDNHFDKTLWKTEKDLNASLESITLPAQLSPEQRSRIATEWQNNLRLYIKDFTQKEIVRLRDSVQESVLAGNRQDALKRSIKASYDVTLNKAKFLARQETRLLLTKFKQTRYESAGVDEYRWGCAKRPHQSKGAPYIKGEVRHEHGILEGKIFSWKNPPITDERGSRNNPGQDYNCRCFAIPLVSFKK